MFNALKESEHLRSVHSLLRKVFASLDVIYFINFIFYYFNLMLIPLKFRHTSPSEDGDIHFPLFETFKSVGVFRLDFKSKSLRSC